MAAAVKLLDAVSETTDGDSFSARPPSDKYKGEKPSSIIQVDISGALSQGFMFWRDTGYEQPRKTGTESKIT